jgi:hypothetical protein
VSLGSRHTLGLTTRTFYEKIPAVILEKRLPAGKLMVDKVPPGGMM